MKSWDKEVEQSFLKDEKAVIRNLEKCYQSALKEIDTKIGSFATRISAGNNVKSAIYQMHYQQELKKQIEESIKNLQSNNYSTITDYLQSTYKNSFVGAQYALHKQGIPLITPINQQSMIQALMLNSKISNGLYNRLGVDVEQFKQIITVEVSRGIATGSSWNQIAKQISNKGNVAYSNASRIARTEGHRIQSEAKIDAYTSAKTKGADIVKQWDSTLDGKTRDTHRKLDGQIRELYEDFEVNGMTVSAPGHFGDPAEDCNCRCCLLQRARWALDAEELKTLQDRAEYFGLDKSKDFNDFKEKYLNVVENSSESGIIEEKSQKPITKITDSAIERVPKVDINGYTEEQCIEIQKQHKELLQYSRDKNENKEVAFVFDREIGGRKEFTGSDDALDFGSSLYGKDLFVMHNHPRNSSYSLNDIIFFWNNDNIKTLTIVKNNGNIEYITKYSDYDSKKFKLEYDRLYKKIVIKDTDVEKDRLVRTLLNKTKSGVIWSDRK